MGRNGPREPVIGASSGEMPTLGETRLVLMGDREPRQGDGVGKAQRQAQVVFNAERLLQQHRRHHKAGALCLCHPPWLQEWAGWKNIWGFFCEKQGVSFIENSTWVVRNSALF